MEEEPQQERQQIKKQKEPIPMCAQDIGYKRDVEEETSHKRL